MIDEPLEIQKIALNLIASDQRAHATYLLTTSAILVAFFGIFLSVGNMVRATLIFLSWIPFSLFIYGYSRWNYYTDLATYSRHEHLAQIIDKIKRDGCFKSGIIYETIRRLKDKFEGRDIEKKCKTSESSKENSEEKPNKLKTLKKIIFRFAVGKHKFKYVLLVSLLLNFALLCIYRYRVGILSFFYNLHLLMP